MTNQGTREELLRLLRRPGGEYLSGQALSGALGVSRSAVWKQIHLLREQGYVIEAVPSRGYRLAETPDALLPAEIQAGLETALIGRELICLAETDSTNARAHELGEAGAVEGTVVIADQQSAGKGRLGRRWTSPAGVNLYASVLLRPALPPRCAPQLTFVSAVAVARAVREVSALPAMVKWPNDVLIAGRKVAGLLNEMSAETERIHYVILGIGVNLNMAPEQFPADLRYPATSLAMETGAPISRLAFTRSLLRELDQLYRLYLDQGVAPVLQLWQSLFSLQGRQVSVDLGGQQLCGRVEGLDGDGALLLRLDDGRLERILAGDVRPLAED
jgi:BirA family transcriptional regulator, biotin operon repressor / biotin---[acetyl-CoA-carboxylase] ligase